MVAKKHTALITQTLQRILLGLNLGAIVLLWIVCACQWISPATITNAAVACLTLPFVFLANLLFLPLWIVLKWRYTAIPIIGIALCSGSICTYTPLFHSQHSADTLQSLRVLTYNTHSWGGRDATIDGTNQLAQWIVQQKPDVALLQEVTEKGEAYNQLVEAGYTVLVNKGKCKVGIATLLPIIESQDLNIPTEEANGAMLARLVWKQDTISFISVHLESFKLLDDDKSEYRDVVTHPTQTQTKQRSQALVAKIKPALAIHGKQTESLVALIDSLQDNSQKVVLAGDFNDVPNSYACTNMRKRLTDCYRQSAQGPGFTYSQQLMYFRIDHIFCSQSLQPLRTWVDKTAIWSDHYPVISYLE